MTIRQRLEDLRRAWWLRKCRTIGVDVRLEGRPTIEVHGGDMCLGDQFRLASHPVESHLAVGPKGVLKIGSNVCIAHGAAIAAFERVEIGSGTMVGPFVIIMDTNFHGSAGDQSVRHDCRPVIIGSGCRIGSRVTITRGASIGDGAEILAGSVVSSAIPPGARAGGARARVLGSAAEPFYQWGNAHDGIDPH
jgi:acetyltransferase-like isoleucine patch superfamily enzyme